MFGWRCSAGGVGVGVRVGVGVGVGGGVGVGVGVGDGGNGGDGGDGGGGVVGGVGNSSSRSSSSNRGGRGGSGVRGSGRTCVIVSDVVNEDTGTMTHDLYVDSIRPDNKFFGSRESNAFGPRNEDSW